MITIIRHAEAEGNCYRRVHGQYDSLLTPNGEAQLETLRGRFHDTVFDAVYASDLYRARRTASALRAAGGQPVRTLPALREIHLGDWEDMPWGELAVCDPENLSVFRHDPGRFASRGASGESMRDVQARMFDAVRDLARTHAGRHIAVVSHGQAIQTLMAALMALPMDRLSEITHTDNTAVSRIEWDGHSAPTILFHGDNAHVGDLSTLGRQHWWRKDNRLTDTNLWFQPAILPRDLPQIHAFQRDAWLTVYGSLDDFHNDTSNAHIERMAANHPKAVVFAMAERTPVGLLQLDTELVTPDDTGHISLLSLAPEARGRALGVQLIGHAVSIYRAMGRKALHLRVAEGNTAGRRLYEKAGFRETGREEGLQGDLIVMKMGIEVS